ncbi:MAG: hypothetical protein IJY40_07480 [Oscillospiraceae bacterium]|nr:hypothetical protein [Oscillospiraceae bacterium]
MKPFYGIDRTTLKKNTFHEGDCFIAASVSDMTRQSYERALQSAAKELEATKLNPVLRGLKTVCSWITLFGFLSTIRALRNVTMAEAFENAPFIFWLMGGCGIVWLVLTILTNRKAKNVMEGEGFGQSTRRLEGEIDRVFRELQVPEDAKQVDVVQLTYRWKNGTVKISTTGSETTPYTNVSLRVFRREDVLCLADLENRYELPISAMRRLKMVKKPLVIQGWNKEEKLSDPFYKPYKLTMDNYERVHTKSYGLLELNHDGVDWALWLPPYELNYISALTGLPITEE